MATGVWESMFMQEDGTLGLVSGWDIAFCHLMYGSKATSLAEASEILEKTRPLSQNKDISFV
jgi:hypothetical protein